MMCTSPKPLWKTIIRTLILPKKKKLTFVTLVMDCVYPIRFSVYGGGSFNAVAGLNSLKTEPGERAVIQTVGAGGATPAVFKTVKSYGKVTIFLNAT